PHDAAKAGRPSFPHLFGLFDENQGLRDSLRAVDPARKALRLRPGPSVGVHYRLSLVQGATEGVELFFHKLKTGEELKARDPILALRRYSQEEIAHGRGRARNPDFR